MRGPLLLLALLALALPSPAGADDDLDLSVYDTLPPNTAWPAAIDRQPPGRRRDVLGPGPSMRVLVVEDEDRIARFLVKGLSAHGFDVDRAETGDAAIAAATDAAPYDLLVLDLGLPDIDGLDVLVTLRERRVPTPVVVLTARGEAADRARALELGAAEYLVKPVPFGELLGSVRATVAG
jgi:CheY-like chemotaxis protein